jgi:hypothetical protein
MKTIEKLLGCGGRRSGALRSTVFHPQGWEDFTYWATANKKLPADCRRPRPLTSTVTKSLVPCPLLVLLDEGCMVGTSLGAAPSRAFERMTKA